MGVAAVEIVGAAAWAGAAGTSTVAATSSPSAMLVILVRVIGGFHADRERLLPATLFSVFLIWHTRRTFARRFANDMTNETCLRNLLHASDEDARESREVRGRGANGLAYRTEASPPVSARGAILPICADLRKRRKRWLGTLVRAGACLLAKLDESVVRIHCLDDLLDQPLEPGQQRSPAGCSRFEPRRPQVPRGRQPPCRQSPRP